MWWCSLRIFLISQQTFPYPLSFCWWWHSPPQPLITLKLLLYCLCSLASLGCAKWAPPNSTCPILVCDVNWRGDWGKAQCAQNCNDKTWKMHTALRGAIRETVNKKKCFKVYFLGFKRERALRSLEEGTCSLCQTVPEYQWPLPPFSAPFIRWWRGMDRSIKAEGWKDQYCMNHGVPQGLLLGHFSCGLPRRCDTVSCPRRPLRFLWTCKHKVRLAYFRMDRMQTYSGY